MTAMEGRQAVVKGKGLRGRRAPAGGDACEPYPIASRAGRNGFPNAFATPMHVM